MLKLRTLAAVSLLATTMIAVPANAQVTGDNRGNTGCTQDQRGGGGGAGDVAPGGRSQEARQAVLASLIGAAVSNVTVEASVLNDALNNPNLQVVCLNNVLNQNEVNLVRDVLNNSPVLSQNTIVLHDILQNFLNDNNILNGAEIVSVDLLSGNLYVLS
jgi:hypothetical protein